jgi:hypothetical protein
MKVVLHSTLLLILFFGGGCAVRPDRIHQEGMAPQAGDTAIPDEHFVLWEPCTIDEARHWTLSSADDGEAALRAASCYVVLIQEEKGKARQLQFAIDGRKSAEAAVRHFPRSGLAHYLLALLTGLEAERAHLRGLQLVPTIERESLLAAQLNP